MQHFCIFTSVSIIFINLGFLINYILQYYYIKKIIYYFFVCKCINANNNGFLSLYCFFKYVIGELRSHSELRKSL